MLSQDDVIIPLVYLKNETDDGMSNRPFVDAVALCLSSIFSNNTDLCVRFAPKMIEVITFLAKTGSKSVELLDVLKTLLISNGQTVAQAQIVVCKGASMSHDLIELTGARETH